MKVQCPNCNRNYTIEDHRVPDGGLKMRCPQCSTSFTVAKTAGDTDDSHVTLPKKPTKQVGETGTPDKTSTNKTQLMFSSSSEYDEHSIDIPDMDETIDLPAPANTADTSQANDDDLFGEIDLPAPARSKDSQTPYGSDPKSPTVENEDPLGEIDLPAPSDNVDLPAPIGSRPKSPTAEGEDPLGEIDLPTPSGNVDLPAPTGSRPGVPTAESDDQFGEIDLPTPSDNVDFPIPVATVDLPTPSENVGLPARKETKAFNEVRPPAPPPSIQPPAAMSSPPNADEAESSPSDLLHGFDDISLSSISAPPDKHQNIPSKLPDIPGGNKEKAEADPLTFPKSLAPPPVPGAGARASGDISFGEVDLSSSSSTPPEQDSSFPGVAIAGTPSEAPIIANDEFDAFPTRESLPGEDEPDDTSLELAHDPFLEALDDKPTDGDAIGDEERRPAAIFEGRRKWERQGRKTRIMLLAFLSVLILGGAGMTFTPLGPFGAYALVKLIPKFGQESVITQTTALVDKRLKTDTPFALNDALKEIEFGLSELPDNEDLTLLGVYLHTWYQIRFGADKEHDRAAMKLLGPIDLSESESPYAPLAEASRHALTRQIGKMKMALGDKTGKTINGSALMIAGYLNAGINEKALTFAVQLDERENSARSGFFLAKALSLNGAHSEAIEKLTALIKKYPKHTDAKLVLAQTYLQTRPLNRDNILKLASEIASSQADLSTPVQKAEAHASLGHLHLIEHHIEKALKAFEQAESLNPDSISMLLGKGEIGLVNNDVPTAVSAFNKVLSVNSNNVEAQLGRVETMLRGGQFADALSRLSVILPANQKNARAHCLTGKVELELKHIETAEQELKAALQLDNEYLDAYIALSGLYIDTDKNSEAMAILDTASKTLPDSPLISRALAEAHAMRGDYATSIVELFKAIDLDPNDIRSYFSMAQMYRRMNSIDDARNSLIEVENRNPSYPGLALERGLLMELSGDTAAALELYKKELSVSKDDLDLKTRIGATSHILGDNETAEKLLKEVIAFIPKSAEANYYFGEVCRVTGRVAEAVGFLKTAAEQDPSNALYHLRYGMSLQKSQDLKEAMIEYETAKNLDPNLAEVYVRIGSVLLEQGAAKDAFQFLDKGLELDPTQYDAYWLMADSFEQRGELRSAVKHYRKAITAAPNEAELYFRLGRVELKVYGNRAALSTLLKATQLVEKVGQTPTWFPEALYRLGIAQQTSGMKTNARATFKRYLEIAPEDDIDRSEVLARLERLGG